MKKKNYLTPKFLMFDIFREFMQNGKFIKHKEFVEIPDTLIYSYLNYTCFAIIIHRRNLIHNSGYYSFINSDDFMCLNFDINERCIKVNLSSEVFKEANRDFGANTFHIVGDSNHYDFKIE